MGKTNSDSIGCFKCYALLDKYKDRVNQQADYIRQLEEEIKNLLENNK